MHSEIGVITKIYHPNVQSVAVYQFTKHNFYLVAVSPRIQSFSLLTAVSELFTRVEVVLLQWSQ